MTNEITLECSTHGTCFPFGMMLHLSKTNLSTVHCTFTIGTSFWMVKPQIGMSSWLYMDTNLSIYNALSNHRWRYEHCDAKCKVPCLLILCAFFQSDRECGTIHSTIGLQPCWWTPWRTYTIDQWMRRKRWMGSYQRNWYFDWLIVIDPIKITAHASAGAFR